MKHTKRLTKSLGNSLNSKYIFATEHHILRKQHPLINTIILFMSGESLCPHYSYIIHPKVGITSRLFFVPAPRWWNERPLDVRMMAETLTVLKQRMKTYLFPKYFN